ELGLFYRLAPVTFVGGSLIPHGGQNPLEPAQLDCAILLGPHTANFRQIAAALTEASAIETVRDADELAAAVGHLLADGALRDRRAAAAARVAAGQRDVLDAYIAALRPFLDRLNAANGADGVAADRTENR